MIVGGGQVDSGLSGDAPERGGLISMLRKELFGGIKDSRDRFLGIRGNNKRMYKTDVLITQGLLFPPGMWSDNRSHLPRRMPGCVRSKPS
jgi:hypothetical protein